MLSQLNKNKNPDASGTGNDRDGLQNWHWPMVQSDGTCDIWCGCRFGFPEPDERVIISYEQTIEETGGDLLRSPLFS